MKTIAKITTAVLCCILVYSLTLNLKTKSSFASNEGGQKVLICHNSHDIWINANAVSAHLGHGDHLGSCEPEVDPCDQCQLDFQNCIANGGTDCKTKYSECSKANGCSTAPEAPPTAGK